VLPADRSGDGSDTVDVGGLMPVAQPESRAGKALLAEIRCGPVPLSTLSATVARPIFSASRRPPQPAVVGPPVERTITLAPAPAEPAVPAVGADRGGCREGDAIAVFFAGRRRRSLRLRQGDTQCGMAAQRRTGPGGHLRESRPQRGARAEPPGGAAAAPRGWPSDTQPVAASSTAPMRRFAKVDAEERRVDGL